MAKAKAKTRKKLGNPSVLPGTFASRVFVGGSYKASSGATGLPPRMLLEMICQVVRDCGLHPIVADEFAVEKPEVNIHHDAIFCCPRAVWRYLSFRRFLVQ